MHMQESSYDSFKQMAHLPSTTLFQFLRRPQLGKRPRGRPPSTPEGALVGHDDVSLRFDIGRRAEQPLRVIARPAEHKPRSLLPRRLLRVVFLPESRGGWHLVGVHPTRGNLLEIGKLAQHLDVAGL